MTEQATVIHIDGSRVTLECREEEKCKACTSGFCTVKNGRQIIAKNGSGLDLKTGDRVDVHIPTGKTIFAGFMVLIFPLILFFVAYYATEKIFPALSEGVKLLSGFGGITFGFLLNFFLGKLGTAAQMPIVESLAAENEGDQAEPDFMSL